MIYGIGIAILFSLSQTQLQQEAQPSVRPNLQETQAPQSQYPIVRFKSTQTRKLETLREFQKSDFYRTIIDKNLFRPLGWKPSPPKEPYRLLGTIIPKDGKSPPQAILQTTAGNKIYTVTRGDTLGTDTSITDIQAKQVTLKKAGQQRILKLNPRPWLK